MERANTRLAARLRRCTLMMALLKRNSAFFIPYLLFLLCGGVVLACYSKTGIALYINRHHSPAADFFFKYWTMFGLGIIIVPVLLILLFVRLRYVIIAAFTFLITVVINDTIKFAVGAPRPAEVFAQLHQSLYFVPGEKIDYWNSFPSGHSAIGFCLFSALALFSGKPLLKFLFFVVAFLIAYSRMYLSEHFLIDVYVASIIGVCSTLLSYYSGNRLPWLNNKTGIMDKPVIPLRKV